MGIGIFENLQSVEFLISKIINRFLLNEMYNSNFCSECNKRYLINTIFRQFKLFYSEKSNISSPDEKLLKCEFINKMLTNLEFMQNIDYIGICGKNAYKKEYAHRLISALINIFPENALYIKYAIILICNNTNSANKAENMKIAKSYLKNTNDLGVWLLYVNSCFEIFEDYAEGCKIIEKLIELKESNSEKLFIIYKYLLHKLSLFYKGIIKYSEIQHDIKILMNSVLKLLKNEKIQIKNMPEILPMELISLEKIIESLLFPIIRNHEIFDEISTIKFIYENGQNIEIILFNILQWSKYLLYGLENMIEFFDAKISQFLTQINSNLITQNPKICFGIFKENVFCDNLRIVNFENKINPSFSPKIMKNQTEFAIHENPYNLYCWLLYLKYLLKTSYISNKIFEIKSNFGSSELSLFHYIIFMLCELSYSNKIIEIPDTFYQPEKLHKLFKDGWRNHIKYSIDKVTTSNFEKTQNICENNIHLENCNKLFEDYYITKKYWKIYVKYGVNNAEFEKYQLLYLNICSYGKSAYLEYYKKKAEKIDKLSENERKELEGIFSLQNEKEIRFNSIINPI